MTQQERPDATDNQILILKTTEDAGLKPCDDCGEPATVFGKVFDYCAACDAMEREISNSNHYPY